MGETSNVLTHGAHLRAWREAAGLSQAEMARRCGKTRQSISQWENNKTSPLLQQLRTYARECGTTLDLLLESFPARMRTSRQRAS